MRGEEIRESGDGRSKSVQVRDRKKGLLVRTL